MSSLVRNRNSAPSLVTTDTWDSDVVPRLPANLSEKAKELKAFQRVRNIASPYDLLRAILAYTLCGLSMRRLGCWSALMGLGDISEAAWRKRLRSCNGLALWLLSELIATPDPPDPLGSRTEGHVLLVDATRLSVPGGSGDDWRVHLSYDFTSARLGQVVVTDNHTAEGLVHFRLRPADVVVADGGYGYRREAATALGQKAHCVLRIHPATFPLQGEDGEAFNVFEWLRKGVSDEREWSGWFLWKGDQLKVRLIAARLLPDKAEAVRRRKIKKAKDVGRKITIETLESAGWILLVTTLDRDNWSKSDVLRLYRARWQVELVFKRMKQLLKLNQIRTKERASVEPTVRILLVAWALQEDVMNEIRELLSNGPETEVMPISSWILAGLCLDILRSQVLGRWSLAALLASLPTTKRFLFIGHRMRRHQETETRAWLMDRCATQQARLTEVA